MPQAAAPVQKPAAPAAADGWEAAAAAAPARSRGRAAAPAPPRGAGGSADGAGGAAGEEEQLAFGGGHVLELFDLTPAVRTQHLEAFLERLCSGHPAPPTVK